MSPLSKAFVYWANGLSVPRKLAQELKAAGYDPKALEAAHRAPRAE